MKRQIHDKIKELQVDLDKSVERDSVEPDFFNQMQDQVIASSVGNPAKQEAVSQEVFAKVQDNVIGAIGQPAKVRSLTSVWKWSASIAAVLLCVFWLWSSEYVDTGNFADNSLSDDQLLELVQAYVSEEEIEEIYDELGEESSTLTDEELEILLEEDLEYADEDLLESLM